MNLKYQMNEEEAKKWTIEKERSDSGSICGLQKKIQAYLKCFQMMPGVDKRRLE